MKVNRAVIALTICLAQVFTPNVRATPASKGLLGQVVPDYLPDLVNWTVDVSAEMQGGGVLPGSPQSSSGNIYYFEADQDTVVSFIFAKTYYRSIRSPWISVTTDLSNPYRVMPDITLKRIRTQDQNASLAPKESGPFVMVSYGASQGEAEARARLKAELEEQAELARASKTADIFQFNLEVYDDVYRNERAAVRSSIAQFKTDARFRDVSVAPPGRAEIYKKLVLRNRGESVTIEPESLYNIATDSSLSPTIRIQSVKAMMPEGVGALDRKNLDLLRREAHTPSSKLYVSSLSQLMKVGEQTDKDEIVKSLESGDSQRVTSVMTAMQAADWKEGRAALVKLANNEKTQPAIKELAREGAAKFSPYRAVSGEVVRSYLADRGEWRAANRDSGMSANRSNASSQKLTVSPAAAGTEADLKLRPRDDGVTGILVNFRALRPLEGATNYVLWAIDPEKRIVRLGQVTVSPNRREGQIATETSLAKFGLFVTAEKAAMVTQPTGTIVAEIKQAAQPKP